MRRRQRKAVASFSFQEICIMARVQNIIKPFKTREDQIEIKVAHLVVPPIELKTEVSGSQPVELKAE